MKPMSYTKKRMEQIKTLSDKFNQFRLIEKTKWVGEMGGCIIINNKLSSYHFSDF